MELGSAKRGTEVYDVMGGTNGILSVAQWEFDLRTPDAP